METAQPKRDRRRMPEDPDTLRRLAERYNEGATVRMLAADLGWAYGTTYRRLSMAQAGGLLVLRPRGYRVASRNRV